MRYYEKTLPDAEEIVMCQVHQIAEMGAYVHLLEYDNAEGMILLSELSRRRIRSIQKLIRVGRNEVVVVLRVDKEKEKVGYVEPGNGRKTHFHSAAGYIDLSKRRVSPEDVMKCEERYNKSRAVHTILAHVAGKMKTPLEDLYETVAWPLDKKYGHAFDAFKVAITDPNQVFGEMTLEPEVRREIEANIERRMKPQPVKIRADVEVTCFGYEGIDAIKRALTACEAASTEEIPLKVKLVAPPLYVVVAHTTDKSGGLTLMEEAITKIEKSIVEAGGALNIKMKPKAVSEVEDQELEQLMARVEKENAEVEGDEDSDDE